MKSSFRESSPYGEFVFRKFKINPLMYPSGEPFKGQSKVKSSQLYLQRESDKSK